MRCQFINIIGIDGSGKTTLCKALARELSKKNQTFYYVHSYHKPFLLKPFKILAKAVFMRGTDEFGGYELYRERKVLASEKHRLLSRAYFVLWIFDYLLQTFLQVGFLRLRRVYLIADRYIFDAILNASLTANLSLDVSGRIVDMLLKVFPQPDVVFLIDIPEEVAFARKNDIQSVEYLRERRHVYLEMADRYGFIKLDGQAEPQAILAQAKRALAC